MFSGLFAFIICMAFLGTMFGIAVKLAMDALFQAKFFWFGMYLADAIFVAVWIVEFALSR